MKSDSDMPVQVDAFTYHAKGMVEWCKPRVGCALWKSQRLVREYDTEDAIITIQVSGTGEIRAVTVGTGIRVTGRVIAGF